MERPIIDWSAPMPEPLPGEQRTPTLAEALTALAELGTHPPSRARHRPTVAGHVKTQRRTKGKAAKNARRRNR